MQLTRVSRGRPALTLPHVRYGLSMRRMAVLCTFRKLSMCRQGHRPLMRNKLLDLTPMVPATTYHQRNYVETYSRSMTERGKDVLVILFLTALFPGVLLGGWVIFRLMVR